MTKPLFQLGSFQFDLPNGVPQALDRSSAYRWEEQGRLLREPAWQFVGPGSQTITLDGVMYPQERIAGKVATMETLRDMATEGKPLMFTTGNGRVFGRWCIKNLREGQSLYVEGGSPRRIAFTVELVKYGEDNPGTKASPLSTAPGSLLDQATRAGLPSFTEAGSAFSNSLAFSGSALATQATNAGFSLGQLSSIVSTGVSIAQQVSSGDYVNAALGTFGLFGFDQGKASGWAKLGIDAANLAQTYVNKQGPYGMAVALDAVSRIGTSAMVQAGVVQQQDAVAINNLLKSAATVSTILTPDPKITNTISSLVLPK